jgi:nitroimidazol reductase NimA-like FMN-containing flavoprotein (pyridoxamine 5'-phosphate oxidase superfamily)
VLGELNAKEIEQLLHDEVIARLGCHVDGLTYVVPITYAYDGEALIGHSADGLKLQLMRQNPEVCVEVDHMDTLVQWRSVIAWVRYEELCGDAARAAMATLMQHLRTLMLRQTGQPSEGFAKAHKADVQGRQVVVYRIRLTHKTGRFERHEAWEGGL